MFIDSINMVTIYKKDYKRSGVQKIQISVGVERRDNKNSAVVQLWGRVEVGQVF